MNCSEDSICISLHCTANLEACTYWHAIDSDKNQNSFAINRRQDKKVYCFLWVFWAAHKMFSRIQNSEFARIFQQMGCTHVYLFTIDFRGLRTRQIMWWAVLTHYQNLLFYVITSNLSIASYFPNIFLLTFTCSHHLGINYYVNFLGGLGSNKFQIKWRFGIHGNWKN